MASRRIERSAQAPRVVGPYSQAVRSSGLLFLSGQIALDPATGKLVEGSIEDQTRQVMQNLTAVLSSGGSALSRVVKTTIYLTDLADFARVNAVYASYFRSDPPARSTVQVAKLPLGAAIEIDMIAEAP